MERVIKHWLPREMVEVFKGFSVMLSLTRWWAVKTCSWQSWRSFPPKWFYNFGWSLNYASSKKDKQDKTAGRYTINHWDSVNSSSRISRGEKIPQKSVKSYRKETGCPAVTGSTGQVIRKLHCQCSQAMCHCQWKISTQQHQGSISISCKHKCLSSWLITASLKKKSPWLSH